MSTSLFWISTVFSLMLIQVLPIVTITYSSTFHSSLAMSTTSLLWISTVFCLILIQDHSADIQQVKEDTIEGMCMKKTVDHEEPQCAGNMNQLTPDEIETGTLPKRMEKVEEEAVVDQENMTAEGDSKDTTQENSIKETNQGTIEVTRRDIESVEEQSEDIAPPVPSPPPSPKLQKLPEVEVLLEEEEKMLNYVRDYVENETLRLEQLNKNLAHWTKISNYSMADPQGYLSVYLNCFHLLKRMAFDIPNDILNNSLYDTSFREEDLDQWDIYSEHHHLVSFINSSPQKMELLDSLDAYGILSLLNSNSDLSVPESTMVDILSNSLIHRPLEFEELTSEDIILDSLLEYVTKLDQTQSSKLLIESAKLKYPLSEKLAR
uniref:Prolyl 4-hydroxylase N-terminal domain-containing protein n=2 Tax=Cacopsylla melanoneura TaxID=428564 RepID=A0A8D8WHV9_9HEMI